MHPSWDVQSDPCPPLKGKYPNGPVFLHSISYKQAAVSGKLLDVGGIGLSSFVHANKVFLFNVKDPELIGFEFNEDNLATRTQIAGWAVTHVKKHKAETFQVVCTIGEISIAFFVDPVSAEKIDITLPVPRDNVVCTRKQNSMPNGTDVLEWLMQQVRPVNLSTLSEDTLVKVNDLFRQMGIREISTTSSIVSAPAAGGGGAAKKASPATRTTLSYATAASIPSSIEELDLKIQHLEQERARKLAEEESRRVYLLAQEEAKKVQEKTMIINAIKNADHDLLSAIVEKLDLEQISSLEQLIAIQLDVLSTNAALAATAEAARRKAEISSLSSELQASFTIPLGDVISGATAEEYLESQKKDAEEKLAAKKAKAKATAVAKKAKARANAEASEAAAKALKEDREKRKADFEASVASSQTPSNESINRFQAFSNEGCSKQGSRASTPWSEYPSDNEEDDA